MATESTLLLALDLTGTFVFALSGGLDAVRARLDIFGVVVVGVVTAIGGGILRDTLLGLDPPNSLRNWPYLAVPTAAAITSFYFHPRVARLRRTVLVLDAAGLGLFTVSGTRVALTTGLSPSGACAVGLLTGIGGGIARDVLLRQVPLVLRRGQIYAIAALVGAVLVCVGWTALLPPAPWLVGCAALIFVLRLLAVRRHWEAPVPKALPDEA